MAGAPTHGRIGLWHHSLKCSCHCRRRKDQIHSFQNLNSTRACKASSTSKCFERMPVRRGERRGGTMRDTSLSTLSSQRLDIGVDGEISTDDESTELRTASTVQISSPLGFSSSTRRKSIRLGYCEYTRILNLIIALLCSLRFLSLVQCYLSSFPSAATY